MSALPDAGWYPDPEQPGQQRWWDGTRWADQRRAVPNHTPLAIVPAPGGYAQPSGTSGWAVAALVCAFLAPLLGLIFGIVALRSISQSGNRLGGRGLAITGIVFGSAWMLLVVAIMMAVAVPAFLGQKQRALATTAKVNAIQLDAAIQSCSAGSATTPSQCLVASTLTSRVSPPVATALSHGCTVPNGACVQADGTGYVVRTTVDSGTALTTFEYRRAGGTVTKTCTINPKVCPTGRW